MTFWPLAEVVRQAAAISDMDGRESALGKLATLLGDDAADVTARLATAVDLATGSFPIQEIYWSARRFFEILSARHPLVVIFDDIHWAEPTLLKLIEYLADETRDAAALVLCSTRHDLLDEHAAWLEGRPNASRIVLQPLSKDDSARIISNFFDRASLPLGIRERVIASADGNPLFVEQMLSMLVDDGVLRRDESGGWIAAGDADAISVPPTISALLAARLDRLAHEERAVLDTGSVAGVIFYEDAVRELCPETLRDKVSVGLVVLTQKQLVGPEVSELIETTAFRFSHVLVREAAYQRLLKRIRADLHERFGVWLEHVTAARALEFEELVGYHLEQASRYLGELGPIDERGASLALRASVKLAASGARASARGDMPATANLVERAMALRPERDPVRIELAVDLADALREMGEFERARSVVTSALDAAAEIENHRLLASLRLVQVLLERSTRSGGWAETALRESERAIAVFEATGDHVGLARAYRLLGTVHGTALRYGSARQAVEQAIEHARLAGDRRQETRSMPALALCALFGPERVEEAIVRCERLAERASGDRRAQSLVLVALSRLCAMHGDFDRARSLYRQARATLEDLGDRMQAAGTSLYAGRIELLADNPTAAEARLRPDYEALHKMGERNYVPTAAAVLAEAVFAQGRSEEAEALTRVSEQLASPSDVESQFRWRCVRAKLLARTGRTVEATDLANAALKLVLATDDPALQADVYADLAVVLAFGGDAEASAGARDRAAELYALKGDVASASRMPADGSLATSALI